MSKSKRVKTPTLSQVFKDARPLENGPLMLPAEVLAVLSQSLTLEAASTVRGYMAGKGLTGNWRFVVMAAGLVPETPTNGEKPTVA